MSVHVKKMAMLFSMVELDVYETVVSPQSPRIMYKVSYKYVVNFLKGHTFLRIWNIKKKNFEEHF